MPEAVVVVTAGINCDRELADAFAGAGARVHRLHLNALLADPASLERYQLIGLPGGFGYGDAIAAGRVQAALMREALYPAFLDALRRGTPIIAPCNGFQVAVQLGLLPGADPEAAPGEAPRPSVALASNVQGRFVDRWSRVSYPESRCVWTRGLDDMPESVRVLPSAHGEGRFVADEATLDALEANGQVAVTYHPEDDPNGSARHVAGITDPTGLVLGLMPHPERYTRWTQHPFWTRLAEDERAGDAPGRRMFRNAVEAAASVPA